MRTCRYLNVCPFFLVNDEKRISKELRRNRINETEKHNEIRPLQNSHWQFSQTKEKIVLKCSMCMKWMAVVVLFLAFLTISWSSASLKGLQSIFGIYGMLAFLRLPTFPENYIYIFFLHYLLSSLFSRCGIFFSTIFLRYFCNMHYMKSHVHVERYAT